MAVLKKKIANVKLQLPPAGATPAPPVGPALGQYQVNIMEFCKHFNEKTKNMSKDLILPVKITIYSDRSFTFQIKTPLTSALLRARAKLEKGATNPGREVVGRIKRSDIREIAKIKLPDLNVDALEKAEKIIEGTARSMGLIVED